MANDPKAAQTTSKPATAPASAQAPTEAKKPRVARVLTTFEQNIKSEQVVVRSIGRKLASLSEDARARVIEMLGTYTAKA